MDDEFNGNDGEDFETPETESVEQNGNAEEKQSVSSDLIRGHINTIILRALYEEDRYGYDIINEIERKSHGQYSLKQPSLYSALKRLEKEGYITSYWGASVSGGRRKYFSLTPAGKAISEQNQSEWEYSRTVIDSLISDKDFDFSNPAPVPVDMRVLRDTTTRARTHSDQPTDSPALSEDHEQAFKELESKRRELEARQAELDQRENELARERESLDKLKGVQQLDSFEEERTTIEDSAGRLEEERAALEEEAEQFELMKKRYEAEMLARNDALLREREWREYEIAQREQRLQEAKKSLEENSRRIGNEELLALDERLREQENELDKQRTLYEEQIREHEREMQDAETRHAEELERREREIIEEQETLFHQREQQLLHQNYLDLISTPPADNSQTDYNYYTAPVGDEPKEDKPLPDNADEEDYRSVVRKIYANSIQKETTQKFVNERATSLDGIDFHDLEARAAQDGIRIYTAGGKSKMQIAQSSHSVMHKGKALFISAVALFVFCIVLGAVLLGIGGSVSIPVYYPYLIWGIALIILLVCGLAYANQYGERSLRRTTYVMIHAIVMFVLLVIFTLIVALSAKIDFKDINQITTFITVPIVFFFGVVIFSAVYYLQVRPKRH